MVVIFASTYTYIISLLLLLLIDTLLVIRLQVKNYNIEITNEIS